MRRNGLFVQHVYLRPSKLWRGRNYKDHRRVSVNWTSETWNGRKGRDLPEVIDKKMHSRAIVWNVVPAVTKVGRKRINFIVVCFNEWVFC